MAQQRQQQNPLQRLSDMMMMHYMMGGGSAAAAPLAGYEAVAASGLHPGTSAAAASPGMMAMAPIAVPTVVGPMLRQLMGGGNEQHQLAALHQMSSGNANQLPLGVLAAQAGGANYFGGDPNVIDRLVESGAQYLGPNMASIPGDPKEFVAKVKSKKDKYKGEKNRAAARAADNAKKQGYKVNKKTVQTRGGRVRKAFRVGSIKRRREQGGR